MTAGALLIVVIECGLTMCLIAGAYLIVLLRVWPRAFLKRYPVEIQNAVGPLDKKERQLAILLSLPFLLFLLGFPAWASYRVNSMESTFVDLFLAAYLTWMVFNLFDWLVLDEFLIGYLKPSWLVLPGAEDIPLTFDHAEHAVAFLKGALGGLPLCGLVAAVVLFIMGDQGVPTG